MSSELTVEEITRIILAQAPRALSPTFKKEQYAMLACAGSVLILSGVGLIARYRRGVAWIFAKDSSGIMRPNAAVLTQLYLALYAAFFLIVIPTYSLKSSPSQGAFIFLLLSFTPLALAFHSTVWATALAPTSYLSTPRPASPVGSSRHPRVANWFFAAAGITVLLTIVPSTILLARARASEIALVEHLLLQLRVANNAETIRTLFARVARGEAPVLLYYRVYTSTWCAWLLLFLVIYVPTSLKLAKSLRSRQRRFQRSSNSLRVLEEMTSREYGDRWSGSATPELPSLKTTPFSYIPPGGSPPSPDQRDSPSPDQRDSLILPLSPYSEFGSPSTSLGKSSPNLSNERTGTEVQRDHWCHPKSRVQTQVEELASSLAKTRRALWLVFNLYLMFATVARINALFMLFIGWTVSIGGLVITLFFVAFSLSGPTFHPPPPHDSQNGDVESADDLHRTPSSDFAPSIQIPELAQHRSPQVPRPSSSDWSDVAKMSEQVSRVTKSQRWVPSEWATARRGLEDDEAETEDLQRRRSS